MAAEKELDVALETALISSDTFRTWFLDKTRQGQGYNRIVLIRSDNPWCKVRVILPNPMTGALEGVDREGETDVLAVFEAPSGRRLGVHIENKIATGRFTQYQPEMYAARGEFWIGKQDYGCYDHWETVLLAPMAFIKRNETEARKFMSRITHEDVALHIPEFSAK